MPKIDKYGLPDDTPDSWAEAVGKGTLAGYGFGSIYGTMKASWSDAPVALRDQAWPGLKRTATIMNHWGLTFATVGASYAATKATAAAIRGTSDWKNGVLGGFAAGAAVGLRAKAGFKPSIAFGAALAIGSAMVDLTDGRMRMNDYFGDGVTARPRLVAERPKNSG